MFGGKMQGRKAQSFTEYIIVFFIFMTIVIFLFNAFFARNQSEAKKIEEQSSNQVAQALAKFLLETTENIGFAPSIDNPNIIPKKKLDSFNALRTQDIIDKLGGLPGSFHTAYTLSAISKTGSSASGVCEPAYIEGNPRIFGICNRLDGPGLYFYFSGLSRAANLKAELYFPLSTVTIDRGTLEPEDKIMQETIDGGTRIRIDINLNSTDLDKFILTSWPKPELVFIRELSFKYSSGENVGNLTISNTTAAADIFIEGDKGYSLVSARKTYAEVTRTVLINASDGTLHPTKFKVQTWRRQRVER